MGLLDETFEAAQLDRAQLAKLYDVGQKIHATLDSETALNLILEYAIELTGADSASISLVNPSTALLEIEASRGLPESLTQDYQLALGHGITGWVAKHDSPALVPNVQEDPRYLSVWGDVRSELAVPFDVQDQIRGVLNVDSTQVGNFKEADQAMLSALAIQASTVIGNTWLFQQLQSKAAMLESLSSINETIQQTLGIDEGLESITREACGLMKATMGSVLLLDDSGQWLDLKAAYGAGENYQAKPRLHIDESFAGTVVRRGHPIQLKDVRHSSLYRNTELAEQEGLVSMLCVPLSTENHMLGVLSIYTDQPHHFSIDEINVLKAFANVSAMAIERATLNREIRQMEEALRSREKLSALGLLAAEVAHEIRNPLTVMKMVYHAMNLQFPEEDPRHEDASLLGRKMDQLNEIVERVLAFARHDEPRVESVNLERLLHSLYALTRHKMRQQSVAFEMHIASDLPLIEADPGQLEQALLNLTLNAIQAMPEGGSLTLHAHRHPSHEACKNIELQFADTGKGMDAKLFESKEGLLHSEKQEGTGLGLMVIRRIIESHSGQLKLTSTSHEGTIISVILPIKRSHPERSEGT